MKSDIIIDVQQEQITTALLEDGRLMELSKESRAENVFAVGNIYYGRVKKLIPSLNAAFVDIGSEKEGFLHYSDLGSAFNTIQAYANKIRKDSRLTAINRFTLQPNCPSKGQIADVMKVGDMVLVQVMKESINSKGPKLTSEISFAGRNMVLMPFSTEILISSKIRKGSEKTRLKRIVKEILPNGYGVIVRTLAEGKEREDLEKELKMLIERWRDAAHTLQKVESISLIIEEMGRTLGNIRDTLTTAYNSVQVNDESVYKEIRQYLKMYVPHATKLVHFYKDEQPIFDHFDVTRQTKSGFGRVVNFKGGGYLFMEATEALFSVDVNSGSKKLKDDQEENAFQFNMLAAEEIAHQLRLRDIGGIIVIDFIDMFKKKHLQQLHEYMITLLKTDRATHNVLPLSKFCLMQITRQRIRPAVTVNVREVCPTCLGKGKIQAPIYFIDEVEQSIKTLYEAEGRGLRLHVHPFIFAFLSKGVLGGKKTAWRLKYGIHLIENQSVGVLQYQFYNKNRELLNLSDYEKV